MSDRRNPDPPPAGADPVPEVAPVPERFPADEDVVRRLVATQFPRWDGLPIRRVANEGWDNRTFHLGDAMSVRLPSAAPYALAVEKEHRWLPVFAPRLPVPVPVPLAKGAPGEGYPHVWSVYRWLDGEPARAETIADLTSFAVDLAAFLCALRGIDASAGPPPGQHNWFRGGPLHTYDGETRRAIDTLAGRVDTEVLRGIWAAALRAEWDGRPTWFHGDVAADNLLVRNGALAGVIDFGTCGVGDPACDLSIAWTLLPAESRAAFRRRLDVDAGSWARGRGWALWKALVTWAGSATAGRDGGGTGDGEGAGDGGSGDVVRAREARRIVDEIVADRGRDRH
ncbi:aminoglycoside phosphotransferase family protein [Streptomyces profundus]|uniref:aminoglycoside phosphotransferase family protein n=1 Tax=Streptomyces profundus TaxID=2867410 RepID=UPI001D164CEA|nr:aminoglycoside phosphotransferase family protein [Streptomyces sp. MA3_2.13]UED83537.1 aminoglycoside phosphotransferase family protein [Streptomyces sp. MA3_2.13]